MSNEREFESLKAGQQTISDKSVVYAYGANGDYSVPYAASEYGDLGAAFNAAVSELNNNIGYGTVVLPATNEDYSTAMVHDARHVDVQGRGMWATRPRYTGSDEGLLIDGASQITVSDLSIRCDGTADQDGIRLYTGNGGMSHLAFYNIHVEGPGRYAINEDTANGNDIYDYIYHTVYLEGSGSHAYYSKTPAADGGTASKTLFNVQSMIGTIGGDFIHDWGSGIHRRYICCEAEPSVSGKGYYIRGPANNITIENCRAEGTGGDGFYIREVDTWQMTNCIAWNCGAYGYNLYGDYENGWMNGLYATGSGEFAMQAQGNGTVENNWLGPANSLEFIAGRGSLSHDMKQGRSNDIGPTTGRPGNPYVGAEYFDTDLGYKIWYDGSDWVDATGSVV